MNDSFNDELLSAYLDGDLTTAELEQVERRLAESAAARQLCDDLRSLRAEIVVLPKQRAPVDFAARVVGLIDQKSSAQNGSAKEKNVVSSAEHSGSSPAEHGGPTLQRDLPAPKSGVSWLAVAGLLGTVAAGIVAILALPGMQNQVAGPNVEPAPRPNAAKDAQVTPAAKRMAKNAVELAAPSAPAETEQREKERQFQANLRGRALNEADKNLEQAGAGAPAENAGAKFEENRAAIQDRLSLEGAPRKPGDGRPTDGLVANGQPQRRTQGAPMGPVAGGGPAAPESGEFKRAAPMPAFAAQPALMKADAGPGAGAGKDPAVGTRGEDPIRLAFANQGIALDVAKGARPDNATREAGDDRSAASKAEAAKLAQYDRFRKQVQDAEDARYFYVEAPAERVDLLVAELQKQEGIKVEVMPASADQAERIVKQNQPQRPIHPTGGQGGGFGGGRLAPAAPGLPPPGAAPAPAAPAAAPAPPPMPIAPAAEPAAPSVGAEEKLVVGESSRGGGAALRDEDGTASKKLQTFGPAGYAYQIVPAEDRTKAKLPGLPEADQAFAPQPAAADAKPAPEAPLVPANAKPAAAEKPAEKLSPKASGQSVKVLLILRHAPVK